MSLNTSQLVLLVASRIIAGSLKENNTDLINANTTWTPEFCNDLIDEVEKLSEYIMGRKNKTALFEATYNLKKAIGPAKADLKTLKIQIQATFKDPASCKVVLDELGYSKFFKKITQRNQIAVIGLLTSYNRTEASFRNEFIEKGIPAALLDRIYTYIEVVNKANIIQEQLKITTKSITAENLKLLEDLYKKIIKICKIAADYYQEKRAKKEMFTYCKVVSNLGYIHQNESSKKTKAKSTSITSSQGTQ